MVRSDRRGWLLAGTILRPFLVVVIVVTGLVMSFVYMTRPTSYALYQATAGQASCTVTETPQGVILVIPLRSLKDVGGTFSSISEVETIDSANARVVNTDIWMAGVGYGAEETPPSPELTELAWLRDRHTPTTVDLHTVGDGNLAIAIAPEDPKRPITIGTIRTISVTGEPTYAQEFAINLRAVGGRCELSPAPE